MKSATVKILLFLALLALLLSYCSILWARTTTAQQAEKVVAGWLKTDRQPLGMALGQQIMNVETFSDANGQPIYYVVYLLPSGFVIVSADDLVEPIIAFVDDGTFDPSVDNPLGALVSQDLKWRVAMVRHLQQTKRLTPGETGTSTQSKWDRLEGLAEESEGELLTMGLGSISDVRVAPLVKSKWNQQNICVSRACYNYYTPQWVWDTYPISGHAIWPEGNSNNYPCGCSATALAQLLRFHEHPNDPCEVGVHNFEIKVRGYIDENNFLEVTESRSTRGGDGNGGPYNWSLMDLTPDCGTTPTERQAIGALCYDASLALETTYSEYGSLVSDADMSSIGSVFQLSNGIFGSNSGVNIGAGLNGMVNPNLDANHPVALAINVTGEPYGHAVIADGYGYDSSTLYHHLNLGWSGTDDAWYNLPTISAGGYSFDCVDGCFYNIFVTGNGEIISGRVTDPYGNPISGATVIAERNGGGTYNATTNSKGIYPLAKVPSASTYTISITNTGYCFETHVVETGTSEGLENTSGNLWAIDFVANHYPQLSNGVVVPDSGDTNTDFYWYIDYYDEDGDPPSIKEIYVDDTNHTMWLYSGSDSNGTYAYGPMKLNPGEHDYYFYFEDGNGCSDRLPGSGTSSGPSVAVPRFVVSGKVTDKYTLGPLRDIRVGCWHEDLEEWVESRTDTNGVYELNDVPLGEVHVIAMPDYNYAHIGSKFELEEDVNDLDFALPPEARLCGKVLDTETAAPLVGIKVVCWNDRYYVQQNDFTDANGRFTLTHLPPSVVEIKAMPDVNTGYAWNLPMGGNWVRLNEGEYKLNRIIALQKGALVSGCIKDANGDPVSTEYGWQGRMCDGWAGTDVNGHYKIRLPLGTHAIGLDLNGEDFTSLRQKATITDVSQPIDVNDITAYSEETGGQISGNVYNPGVHSKNGEFVVLVFEVGTVIDANTWYTTWPVGGVELADVGSFVITGLPPDANFDVHLCVMSETIDGIESLAVRDSALDVLVGTTDINLSYDSEGSTVTGRVENADANVILGACVLLTNLGTGGFAGFGYVDANGEYAIYNAPAGEYAATAVHSKYLNESITISKADTRLLLHLNGADKATDTNDASPSGHSITFWGTAQLDTAAKKWGSASLQLDGDSDYLTIPDSDDWDICGSAADDWTIDFWVRHDSHSAYEVYLHHYQVSYKQWCISHEPGSGLAFYSVGGGPTLTAAEEISDSEWHHIALCKVADEYGMYKDGQQINYTQTSDVGTIDGPLYIGGYAGGSFCFDGHMDEIRITRSNAFNASPDAGKTDTIEVPTGEYSPTPVIPVIVMPFTGEKEGADLNGDGVVDWIDVVQFTDQWLGSGSLEADFKQDGCVNFTDWARLAENWFWQTMWYHD